MAQPTAGVNLGPAGGRKSVSGTAPSLESRTWPSVLMSMAMARQFRLLAALAFLVSAVVSYSAAPLRSTESSDPAAPPALRAQSAILIEADTGATLYAKNPDERIPPASLTKLMTISIALREIENGTLSPSEVVAPASDAWASNMPPHSSLMFLGPDQKLTVDQLLKGLVVDSGNDAAVELADLIAGSVPSFVELMNQEAQRLGYQAMHFVDPAGISASNVVTAREYADFARRFVLDHPDALKDLFSIEKFTYPLAENLTDDNHEKPVTQSNRNLLLGRYKGVDGLKTGYIHESGYNIAVTAKRDGMRLIAVILGIHSLDSADGVALRAAESTELLDYGFQTFTTVHPAFIGPSPVRVWKGTARTVEIKATPEPVVVVRKDQASEVRTRILQVLNVEAPVKAGQALGALVVSLDSVELARFPLKAQASVDRGNFVRRVLDSIALFLIGQQLTGHHRS